jgi:CBS domain-containing protein
MQIKDVTTKEVGFVAPETQVLEIAFNMQESDIGSRSRRLPVVTRTQRFVGVVSLRDLVKASQAKARAAFQGISQPTH